MLMLTASFWFLVVDFLSPLIPFCFQRSTREENRDVAFDLAERLQGALAGQAHAEQVVSGLGFLLGRAAAAVPTTSSAADPPVAVTVTSAVRVMRAGVERVIATSSVAAAYPASGTTTVSSASGLRLSTFASPSRLPASSRARPPVPRRMDESSFITVSLSR